MLWLCGTVGEGKSCAVSAVIEHLSPPILIDPDYIVSYFYISQKRNRRSDPVDIFRCILAQIASFNGDDTIIATLKAMFDERGQDRFSGGGEPSLDGCITLIIELSCCWRRSVFIIDALDECSAPNEVLNGLSDICAKSNSNIKVFLSSRMHVEVSFYFPQCDKILMEEGQHSGDSEAYVRGEVLGQRRRLLDGKRPDLEERLMLIMIERAHGMFIWAKLQLAVFFSSTRFRLSRDVEIKLDKLERDSRLPETNSLYQQIMESNTRPETLDRMYAIRALQ